VERDPQPEFGDKASKFLPKTFKKGKNRITFSAMRHFFEDWRLPIAAGNHKNCEIKI
jgi:hypothetical protein